MKKIGLILLITCTLFLTSCKDSSYYPISSSPSFSTSESDDCLIDIKGEVRRPGIYKIKLGSTLYDLICLAGGFTEYANSNYLNLASIISGNQMIVIPSIKKDDINEENKTTSLININTASIDLLCSLEGIGQAKATNIIEYRTNNGSFKSLDELLNVKGISEKIFSKIKNNICI